MYKPSLLWKSFYSKQFYIHIIKNHSDTGLAPLLAVILFVLFLCAILQSGPVEFFFATILFLLFGGLISTINLLLATALFVFQKFAGLLLPFKTCFRLLNIASIPVTPLALILSILHPVLSGYALQSQAIGTTLYTLFALYSYKKRSH